VFAFQYGFPFHYGELQYGFPFQIGERIERIGERTPFQYGERTFNTGSPFNTGNVLSIQVPLSIRGTFPFQCGERRPPGANRFSESLMFMMASPARVWRLGCGVRQLACLSLRVRGLPPKVPVSLSPTVPVSHNLPVSLFGLAICPPRSPRSQYRGTSLIGNRPPLGPYKSICLGPYGVTSGGGGFV